MEAANPDKKKFDHTNEKPTTEEGVAEDVVDQETMDALSKWLLEGGSKFEKLALVSFVSGY